MYKDITGQKYGRLTAVKHTRCVNRKSYWLWKCDCGQEKEIRLDCVTRHSTVSCGCANRDSHLPKHGQARTKLYHVYHSMKQRCNNPKAGAYEHYGGRGIKVCPEWEDGFEPFYEWAKSSGYKEGLSIDRIDVNKGYAPDNCQWITQAKQLRNTRRNTWIEYRGETRILKDWCDHFGINISTACHRIKVGKSLDEVFGQQTRCND